MERPLTFLRVMVGAAAFLGEPHSLEPLNCHPVHLGRVKLALSDVAKG